MTGLHWFYSEFPILLGICQKSIMFLLSASERQVSQLIQKTVGRRVVAEKSVCIFNMMSHKIPLNVIKYKIFSKKHTVC